MTVILMLISAKIYEFSQVENYFDTQTLNESSKKDIIQLSDEALSDTLQWELDTTQGSIERIFGYALSRPAEKTENALDSVQVEHTLFHQMLFFKMAQLKNLNGDEFNRFVRNQTLLIFLSFIPIIALILKILFYRRKSFYYIDHFTFAVHSQTLLIFSMGLALLFGTLFKVEYPLAIAGTYVLVYQWIALKRFYGLSKIRTAVNYLIINVTLGIVSIIFLLLVIAVSFLIY